ncbi:MAG: trigger factor [Actinomycetota bacterium]
MKTVFEHLDGNRVKLSVEIDEADFSQDIDAAFAKIAKEVRLPGFRAGKAPRKVLEARIGIEAAREQALRDSVPMYLARAVREHNVDIVATPDIQIVGGEQAGPVKFDATCEVRPVVQISGHASLRVEVPALDVSESEVDEVVDAERRRLGTLTTVDKKVAEGDFVIVDLVGSRDGEPVVGLAVDEWSYEVGKKWVAPTFDEKLIGRSAGDVVTFTDTPSGTSEQADFTVTVNAVQQLVLPDLEDSWVAKNIPGVENVAEWRNSIRERLESNRLGQVRNVVIDRVTDSLSELVVIEAPESMIAADLQHRVENTVRQFQMQGISIDQWLQMTGQDAASFVENLRPQSVKAVKVDLALRAVVEAESLHASDDDVENEFALIAARTNENAMREHQMAGSPKNKKVRLVGPDQVRAAYRANDAVVDLAAEISKSKALDWLIHRVEYVDPSGKVLDRDHVIGHSHDDGDRIDSEHVEEAGQSDGE